MEAPKHTLKVIEETFNSGKGFLTLHRANVEFGYEGTDETRQMSVDYVTRRVMDAVCIIPYYVENGNVMVVLRSCIRPAFFFRDFDQSGRPEKSNVGNLWEIPAGLIENDENGIDGVLNAAKRELLEEVGVDTTLILKMVGSASYSSVGLMAERLYFVIAAFAKSNMKEPTLDGSPMELHGKLISVNLQEAIDKINNGTMQVDTKTEIGLNRLKAFVNANENFLE